MAAPLISPGMLTQLRTLGLSTMTDTAQILRNTPVSDGRGGTTDAWSVSSTVACRLTPNNGWREGAANDRYITESNWKILLPSGTDVTATDRIKVTTKANRTFEIKGIDGPKSVEAVLRAYCNEVKS